MSRALGPSCRRCGRKLRAVYAFDAETKSSQPVLFPDVDVSVGVKSLRGRLLGHGYQARSLFCSLTCGYQWACGEIESREKTS